MFLRAKKTVIMFVNGQCYSFAQFTLLSSFSLLFITEVGL